MYGAKGGGTWLCFWERWDKDLDCIELGNAAWVAEELIGRIIYHWVACNFWVFLWPILKNWKINEFLEWWIFMVWPSCFLQNTWLFDCEDYRSGFTRLECNVHCSEFGTVRWNCALLKALRYTERTKWFQWKMKQEHLPRVLKNTLLS